MEQDTLISGYVEDALNRLRRATDGDVRLIQGSAKLRINGGRTIFYVAFELDRPTQCTSVERWLRSLASYVQKESGYGQAEAVLGSDGEVVGGRVEVSYDLKSF